jgi:hypothetical protein
MLLTFAPACTTTKGSQDDGVRLRAVMCDRTTFTTFSHLFYRTYIASLLSFRLRNSAGYAASNKCFEEITMARTTAQSKKWKNMRVTEKAAFIGKLCIFLISFGFAFPTLLND